MINNHINKYLIVATALKPMYEIHRQEHYGARILHISILEMMEVRKPLLASTLQWEGCQSFK